MQIKWLLGMMILSTFMGGCMVDGVCIGNKATCDKEKKDPPGSSTPGTPGYGTAGGDACANAGGILGTWSSSGNSESLKFGKDCSFASNRSGCVRTGTFGIPQSKGAALGLTEAEAIAQDANGVSTFKIAIKPGAASTDEFCAPPNTTLTCDFTISGNTLSMTGCTVPTTVDKFYQKDYSRN